MNRVLCVDAGASSSKWALREANGEVVATGKLAHITGHLFSTEEWQRVTSIVDLLAFELGQVGLVVMGRTGLEIDTTIARKFEVLLKNLLHSSAVEILNDMKLAHGAFFRPGHGGISSLACSNGSESGTKWKQ